MTTDPYNEEVNGEVDFDAMTKDEIIAYAEEKGIELSSSDKRGRRDFIITKITGKEPEVAAPTEAYDIVEFSDLAAKPANKLFWLQMKTNTYIKCVNFQHNKRYGIADKALWKSMIDRKMAVRTVDPFEEV